MARQEVFEVRRRKVDTLFNTTKSLTQFEIKYIEDTANKEGEAIRKDIGYLVKGLKECGIELPGHIDFEIGIAEYDESAKIIKRYFPQDNKAATIRKIMTEYIKKGTGIGLTVDLPKDKQTEEIRGFYKGKEWLQYGPKIIDKLQEETQKFLTTKKQPRFPKKSN